MRFNIKKHSTDKHFIPHSEKTLFNLTTEKFLINPITRSILPPNKKLNFPLSIKLIYFSFLNIHLLILTR
jgi:uncharacterized membrane protein YozB (DUF420 family)